MPRVSSAPMTDRGLTSADGSPACPFVAFEDDRDERADRPDHRHRCFAEAEPAPRALAHQEAYCLSSAFPVCPTFQEWARREAAHAIPVAEAPEEIDDKVASGAAAAAVVAASIDDEDDAEDPWSQPRPEPPIEERPRRNPPRDWAAPPPWASGGAAGAAAAAGGPRGQGSRDHSSASLDATPEEARGLAGSAADRVARGADISEEWGNRSSPRSRSPLEDSPASPADPELAGLVGGAALAAEAAESHPRSVRRRNPLGDPRSARPEIATASGPLRSASGMTVRRGNASVETRPTRRSRRGPGCRASPPCRRSASCSAASSWPL